MLALRIHSGILHTYAIALRTARHGLPVGRIEVHGGKKMTATQKLKELREQIESQGFEQFRVEYLLSKRGLPDRIFYRNGDRHATIARTENGTFAASVDV